MAFARNFDVLLAITFGHRTQLAATKALNARLDANLLCDFINDPTEDALVERLHGFAAGRLTRFDDVPVDMSSRTMFQRKVLEACRAIPAGDTRTYGELAADAGYPGAARAVGSAMANNRTPLIIPCHRVVLASGAAGKFSAPQGEVMRRRLLELEKPQRCSLAKK